MKILADLEDNYKIPTNSSIDELIGGGIEKGTITQIFGPPGSGKSNIALTLTVNVAKNNKKAIYIDTEGGISVERIKQIAKFDFSKIASNIMVFEPTTTILQYWSKVILQLDLGDEPNQRVVTLKRHRSIAEGKSSTFKITSRGIS